jgi:electron transfer flavoprotein beta subunit
LDFAQALKAVAEREHIGLVLCGNQAIDDDLGAVGPLLAALLGWPQAVFVSSLKLSGDELQVSCEADLGLERLALSAPAVLSVDLRLCDPRAVTLPNMMRARKACITSLAFGELYPTAVARSAVMAVAEPPTRQLGLRVNDIAALVEHLRTLPALQPTA